MYLIHKREPSGLGRACEKVYTYASELARYKRSDVCRKRFMQSSPLARHKKKQRKNIKKSDES